MIKKYKKILVIGSNSFTGSNFINLILKKNNQVIGISRSNEYKDVLLSYKKNKFINNFKFYKLDINSKLTKIIKIIDKFQPEVIVNFSAQGEVRNSWKYPYQWYLTNCLSVVNLTTNLVNKNFIKKYISISTPEVYGNTKVALKENIFFSPSTPYASSKLAGDLHLLTLYKKYNFPVLFTRSANVYGPCQQLYRIIPRTIIYLKMNKKIKLHGKGKVKRSFIFVEDVVSAISKVIEGGSKGETFHIAPKGKPISIYELVTFICKIMQKDPKKHIILVDENYGQDSTYLLNSNKIRKKLHWTDSINLVKGIKETIKWIDLNWKKIKNLPLDYQHKI